MSINTTRTNIKWIFFKKQANLVTPFRTFAVICFLYSSMNTLHCVKPSYYSEAWSRYSDVFSLPFPSNLLLTIPFLICIPRKKKQKTFSLKPHPLLVINVCLAPVHTIVFDDRQHIFQSWSVLNLWSQVSLYTGRAMKKWWLLCNYTYPIIVGFGIWDQLTKTISVDTKLLQNSLKMLQSMENVWHINFT